MKRKSLAVCVVCMVLASLVLSVGATTEVTGNKRTAAFDVPGSGCNI